MRLSGNARLAVALVALAGLVATAGVSGLALAQSALRQGYGPSAGPSAADLLAVQKPGQDQTDDRAGTDGAADVKDSDLGRNACISTSRIRSAQIISDELIELDMRGGKRLQMKLADRCTGLSFDQGFYYRTNANGRLCAGFDVIMARSGSRCLIGSIQEKPAASPEAQNAGR